jgi:hypothetical protein
LKANLDRQFENVPPRADLECAFLNGVFADVQIRHDFQPIDERALHWCRYTHDRNPLSRPVQLDVRTLRRRGEDANRITSGV